ncbi:MAG: ABC-F family ATP-binding cassette domain-containing protein [Phycisphaeraceae bacterium]|nr:ABC-F family ATP-binding cassette domain-containing protein [Phycisphaeraceae bacterium]MCW5763564.1 ABC-F family ATP-binding cassette domain-containing protein [Phycisphaeraceae bacterium]
MPVVAATNIAHSFGNDIILENCSISVEPGERIGLVGRNGAGKSTLLRILSGRLKPDSGLVSSQRGITVSYLEQDPRLTPGQTLKDEAEAAFNALHELHIELHKVFDEMASATGETLARLLRRQEDLERRIEAAGGHAIDHRITEVLHGLGFTTEQFALPVEALSGGQRSRLALARVLLEQPDLMLLDEPTNHLDIAGRVWLERFLRDEYKGAVVLVSHDRYLLDNVVDRILETELGRLIEYPGNYHTFRKLRAERRIAQQRAYENQQVQFKREEAFIRKYKAGQRAKQARGRESRLERLREDTSLERPVELATLRLNLPKAERSGDLVVTARGLSKSYTDDDGSKKVLFHDLDVQISRGERWGIIGPNGAGKTTLVRTLLGLIDPDSGTTKLGTKLVIGYYSQMHDDLDPERPVYQYLQAIVRKECPSQALSEQAARDLAGAFLFSGSDQEKPMGVLSGGERTRAVLAGLMASAKNLLILDEPTNHLDIPSAERLEQTLSRGEEGGGFDGTLVIISHDRAFLDATCDHLLILDGRGGAEVFPGTYAEWDRFIAARSSPSPESRPAPPPQRAAPAAAASSGPQPAHHSDTSARKKSKFSWMRVEQIEQRIHELSLRVRTIDADLADPDVWKDVERANALTEERDSLAIEISQLEEEWIRKSE